MKVTYHFFFLLIFLFVACQSQPDANRIVDECIKTHGGENYQHFHIEFDFRTYHYLLSHEGGQFIYQRSFTDSAGRPVEDKLTNTSFTRRVSNQLVSLDSAGRNRYKNAVNSVAYFVLLPFKLNDPAARKTYVGQTIIDGQPYNKIQVSFNAEGGGDDFQDVFFYWIHQKNHTMDYLAYSEGGARFRKAVNPQTVGGIRFQDYINYTSAKGDTTSVGQFDELYRKGMLSVLSQIEQKNIRVTR
ncbi:DUF6503 family protein [Spirosoma sp. SC4-14]|uniref:DUF6503 family protein n=1 Tax=Spirosoma sp. SC4-14 TaxID=3128900 RepID=UPI0030D0917F